MKKQYSLTKRLTAIIRLHDLKEFPTSVWLRKNGYAPLANEISRNGGYIYWAKYFNLPMSNCATRMGMKYEQMCSETLVEMGLDVKRSSVKHPYDILTTAAVKIDVKSSHLYTAPDGSKFFSFNLEKALPTADFFVCYCVGEFEKIEKVYVLPDTTICGNTQVSVGLISSSYDRYINRWDLIKELVDFKKKIRGQL